MKRIYNVLVKNQSGVLCKVSGLFWRRCFNIDSLAVGETEDNAISNMTIVSTGDDHTQEQIEKQLNKKIDVIKVKTFDEKEAVCRELMLIKVKYTRDNRRDIIDNCAVISCVFHFDQHQFAADRFFFVKSLDLDYVNLFIQLFFNLLLGMVVPRAHNRHIGNGVVFRFAYRQGINVEAASPEQPGYFTENTGLVFY